MRAFLLWSSFLFLCVLPSGRSHDSGPTVQVPMTPALAERCRAFFAAQGDPLPPGADITGISVQSNKWKCTSCGTHVEGVTAEWPREAARCTNCGNAMEPNLGETYQHDPQGKIITDVKMIEEILGSGNNGPNNNWSCDTCGNGGNRNEIMGKLVIECESCGADRPGYEGARNSGMPKGKPRQVKPEQVRTMTMRNPSKKTLILGALVAFGIGTTTLAAVTIPDRPVTGTITESKWVQTVRVERFSPVIEEAPRALLVESKTVMPVNGMGEKAGVRILECDGSSCSYETFKWQTYETAVQTGDVSIPVPSNTHWSDLQVPSDGRMMAKTTYEVEYTFTVDGDSYRGTWEPTTPSELQQFKPGSKIEIELDPLQKGKSLKPAKE